MASSKQRRSRFNRLIQDHTHRPGRHSITVYGRAAERLVLPERNGKEWLLVFDAGGYRQAPTS